MFSNDIIFQDFILITYIFIYIVTGGIIYGNIDNIYDLLTVFKRDFT